jgi:hypothetical protein
MSEPWRRNEEEEDEEDELDESVNSPYEHRHHG